MTARRTEEHGLKPSDPAGTEGAVLGTPAMRVDLTFNVNGVPTVMPYAVALANSEAD